MSDPDYSELAARVLAGRPDELRAPRVDRDRGISVVAQAMAEEYGAAAPGGAWFGGLAAAAVGRARREARCFVSGSPSAERAVSVPIATPA